MTMLEYTVSMVIALLSVQVINASWKRFVVWKNDEERKKRNRSRKAVKKQNRKIRSELRAAGLTKKEIDGEI